MPDEISTFECIYENTKSAAVRYIAAKCCNIADIEDIFQETYLSVYRSVTNRTERIESAEAFVITAAKRVLSKYYSTLKKLRTNLSVRLDAGSDRELVEELPATVDVEKLAGDRELLEEIYELVSRAPVTVQRTFYLYYVLDVPMKEISAQLGIEEIKLRRGLSRTLSEIRRLYKRRETV